jgi:hypothetical protein
LEADVLSCGAPPIVTATRRISRHGVPEQWIFADLYGIRQQPASGACPLPAALSEASDVLFVALPAYGNPDQSQQELERWIDITAQFHVRQARLSPNVPDQVQAQHRPAPDPITPPSDRLSRQQSAARVLGELLIQHIPRYLWLADQAVPTAVRSWLAADPCALIGFTWLTPNSYEPFTFPDGAARAYLRARAVEVDLLTNASEDV